MNRPRRRNRHRWPITHADQDIERRRSAAELGRRRAAAQRPLRVTPNTSDVPNVPITGLGRLDNLPNEVILLVFTQCNLRSLLRLERVNKAAKKLVALLPGLPFVRSTAKGIIEHATPPFRHIMFTILKITTYCGLRHLLTTYECEVCDEPGSFRMVKVKVLCDKCNSKKLGGR
ncbi:uncharacterized protein GGS25DRAFT_192405 [Hypoxylon fragiforme]|uniref:uncharacterized protein n=1 Tax=Hypoxylon fragiforme TaxID=63214 RepID=UPI0020C6FC3D|nr:uncharacterized protein GGS25DRAFT_192405 [Hypoxylon fragiforme]KAI2611355.1 hypothetical protein GGS25DRAFT_192405 [Hypoxylon fragiforme]